MSMNEEILADPRSFPAVTGVNMRIIDSVAEGAARQLVADDYTAVVLEPDDGTRYELAIVRAWYEPGAPLRFASSFGCLYPWMGHASIHPDYAQEHYVANDNMWTATVYALWLNSVAEHLAGGDSR